jgi:hypothetical protein
MEEVDRFLEKYEQQRIETPEEILRFLAALRSTEAPPSALFSESR